MTAVIQHPCWLWVRLSEGSDDPPVFGPRLKEGDVVEVLSLGIPPRHWRVTYEGAEYLINRQHVVCSV